VFYGKTRAEVRAKMREASDRFEEGQPVADSKATVVAMADPLGGDHTRREQPQGIHPFAVPDAGNHASDAGALRRTEAGQAQALRH
jgi:hypothetical protein